MITFCVSFALNIMKRDQNLVIKDRKLGQQGKSQENIYNTLQALNAKIINFGQKFVFVILGRMRIWVNLGHKQGHWPKTEGYLANALEATFCAQLISTIFSHVLIIFRSSLNM